MDSFSGQATGSEGFGSPIRSSISVTHHTHGCLKGFRHFRGGRSARSFIGALKNPAFAPFRERALGALRAVRP
jgi:hypothetical protein